MPTGVYKRTKVRSWKLSEKTKRKIGLARKGKPLSEEHKRNIGRANMGKYHSEETKKKLSRIRRGEKRINSSGNNHWNWKGGITPINNKIRSSIESKIWTYTIFVRDKFTCQKTGIKGGRLATHHIFNFAQHPELRFAIDNGITLSFETHKEFHKIYGRKNNTKEQLEEFLNYE